MKVRAVATFLQGHKMKEYHVVFWHDENYSLAQFNSMEEAEAFIKGVAWNSSEDARGIEYELKIIIK